MSSFKRHSHITRHGDKWVNTKTFRFYIDDTMDGEYIEVPEGFVFDGCSVFCPLGQKIEPDTLTSCCLHDYMWHTLEYGFFRSNYIFLIAMRVDRVSSFKKAKYYIGVHLFGGFIYAYRLFKKALQ